MKGKSVIHNSNSNDEWGTPKELFNFLDDYFHFTVDAAASHENALCDIYWTAEKKDKWVSWGADTVWCNPPYSGKNITMFIDRAIKDTEPVSVVMLTTAKTDTKWFHKALANCTTCYLIKGRLKFQGAANLAPFPSCVWVFGKDALKKDKKWVGRVLPLHLTKEQRGL